MNRFRPHIPADIPPNPRTEASGRSDSSGSSTGKTSKGSRSSRSGGANSSNTSFSNPGAGGHDSSGGDDEEDLLSTLVNSGMPKSKSEPLNLKGKLERVGGAGGVVRRDKKGDIKRRSTSKSPRNSKIIPGRKIPELKLKPREKGVSKEAQQDGEVAGNSNVSTPVANPKADRWASPRSRPAVAEQQPSADLGHSMTETLTPASVNKLQDKQQQPRHFDLRGPVPAGLDVIASSADPRGLATSTCSNLSSIQPPSLMMESLMSMSGGDAGKKGSVGSPKASPRSIKQMECRHTLSGKKGHAVPEMVRRALGGPSGGGGVGGLMGSAEDLSSMSSCVSNLDNIQPPTLLDEVMDASIISVASIKSEVADPPQLPPAALQQLQKQPSTESSNSASSDSPSFARKLNEQSSMAAAGGISQIAPPSAMDEVTMVGEMTETLVADVPGAKGGACATYTVEQQGAAEAGVSTCHDVTDVFDDDTTLAPGSDCEAAPELPRDSRHGSPRHSADSSREGTPRSARRALKNKALIDSAKMRYYEEFRVRTPNIDDSSETTAGDVVQDTSGYKSESAAAGNLTPSSPRSSARQRRKEEADRFRTHTITKDDLTPSPNKESKSFLKKASLARLIRQQDSGSDSSPSSSPKRSPKSLKQRRVEEAERFKTHTITQADLKAKAANPSVPLSPMEVRLLEEEANLVANAIEETKSSARSRSASTDLLSNGGRGRRDEDRRSASIEVLDEQEMDLTVQIGQEEEEQQSPRRGPRILKAGEMPSAASPRESSDDAESAKGVRGRRKPLYQSPSKRSAGAIGGPPPLAAPKPTIAPKPKYVKSLSSPAGGGGAGGRVGSPPTQIRGTRASNLRQTSNVGRRSSPPSSPRMSSPRGSVHSGYSSAASSCSSSRASSSRISRQSSATQNSSSRASQPSLVRQGTFTKEDSSSNISSEDVAKPAAGVRTPRRASPKSIRRDVVHPAGTSPRGGPISARPPARGRSAQPTPLQRGQQQPQPRGLAQPVAKFGHPRTNFYARERSSASRGVGVGAPKQTFDASSGSLRKNPSTSSNGSLASVRSAKSSNIPVPRLSGGSTHSAAGAVGGISSSKSSHNLRTPNDSSLVAAAGPMGRRAPSSSSIDHHGHQQRGRNASARSEAGSFSSVRSAEVSQQQVKKQDRKPPKKEGSSSGLTSIWKKVEEAKKKSKEKEKDPRLWIKQGKVEIPESERALLKPHAEQQQIISNFQKQQRQQQQQQQQATTSTAITGGEMKRQGSLSRLSLKLSKFSKGKMAAKDKSGDRTPTSPCSPPSSSDLHGGTNPNLQIEDSLNGNVLSSSRATTDNEMLETPVLSAAPVGVEITDEDGQAKRHSRLGSFFNPESDEVATSTPSAAVLPGPSSTTGSDQMPIRFHSPNRSPAQASAIVPPFNYSPPSKQQQQEANSMMPPPPAPAPVLQPSNVGSKPAAGTKVQSLSSAQVRRNDSYVSSMGRKPAPQEARGAAAAEGGVAEEEDGADTEGPSGEGRRNPSKSTSSSSFMVTLV